MVCWILCCLVALLGWAPFADARESPQRGDAAIAEIRFDALPADARATLALIRKGGPFPFEKDGVTFFNREGLLDFATWVF